MLQFLRCYCCAARGILPLRISGVLIRCRNGRLPCCHRNSEQAKFQEYARGKIMLAKSEKTGRDAADHCGLCGRVAELFEFQGRSEKCCLDCCADLATGVLLSAEIDAATMAGQNANSLASEFAEISDRILERAQSAGIRP